MINNEIFFRKAAILLKIDTMLIPLFNYQVIQYILKIFLVFLFQIIQSRDIVYTAKDIFGGTPGDCVQRP